MPKRLVVALLAVAVLSTMLLAVPVQADDTAAAALQQSFLAMQSVRSYRLTVLMRRPTFDMKDARSVTEMTDIPRAEHKVTTIGTNTYEQVIADDVSYTRKNRDAWTTKAVSKSEAMPWDQDWTKYGPADAYLLIRQDVLDAIPVNAYMAQKTKGDVQTQTEIWIATTDHLPHRIIRHMTYGGRYQMDVIETLSDFNASFQIAVPLQANEAAGEAVKQSFLNLQAVHSYRVAWFTHHPHSDAVDMSTHEEMTQMPLRRRLLSMVGSHESETVITKDTAYMRDGVGPWKTDALKWDQSQPWNSGWMTWYHPESTYVLARRDVLGSIAVNVYTMTRIDHGNGSRSEYEIWVGITDHMPHKIVSHYKDGLSGMRTESLITLSDFNTPIKITVPDVPPPDPSQAQARSNDDN